MNRFFSKLDLRDIKINPTGNSFPPDGETTEEPIEELPEAPVAVATAPELVPAYDDVVDETVSITEPVEAEANEPASTSDVLKVSARSRPSAVAGAIAGVVREAGRAEVQAIGAGAVNQAVKALVLAKGYLAEDGIPVVCVPEFVDVDIDGKIRTAIKLVVEPR